MLFEEVKKPTFKEYHLFFLGEISDVEIRKLASLDETDSVKNIQRLYCNYFAVNEDLFHTGCNPDYSLANVNIEKTKQQFFERMEEGLLSAILSLRILPEIRYLRDNQDALILADRVSARLKALRMRMPREFSQERSVVLILDRREDPLTPLGLDWSYQSLIAEMGEFNNNKVKIGNEEFNLNLTHDLFYKENRVKNYGELSQNLNSMMSRFTSQKDRTKQMENFEDMQKALHQMPEFKKESANIKKHFSIVSEITRQVNTRQLLDLSRLEQEILTKNAPKDHFRESKEFLEDPKVQEFDKLRLASLYCLKYEGSNMSKSVLQLMISNCSDGKDFAAIIEKLLRKCGRSSRVLQRGGNNFGMTARNFYQDIFGVNIYSKYLCHIYNQPNYLK